MRIKYIFFISFVSCLFFLTPQSSFSQYQRPYFEKEHQIDISYSVKKNSLTQDYELIITNVGDLILLQNDYHSGKPKVLNGKLSKGEFNALKDFIISANITNFDNEYILDNDFIKLDSERLRITIDSKTKDILISSSSVPPELQSIINAIKKYKARLLSNATEE